MGGPKALVEFAGHTLHARAVERFRVAGLDVISVVNAQVEAALPPAGAGEVRLINDDPGHADGMFRSVRLAIGEAIARGADGVALLPVDLPLVTPRDVSAVIQGLKTGSPIVVATHRSQRGHPVGLSLAVMREVIAAAPESTLRDIVRRTPERVRLVEASEGAVHGVNTREELERLLHGSFR